MVSVDAMKLSAYLKDNRISHVAFAEKIGVTQATVTRYAAGTRTPRPEHMVKIRSATEGAVTADDFMPAAEAAA